MSPLPKSAARVLQAAQDAGLKIDIQQMAESTRTAAEAAQACGCTVAQIVKSLIFCSASNGRPYLLLVSGRNRVDETLLAGQLGTQLRRPDAQEVRDLTGFAIGGIPPLGHAQPLATYMDKDLLAFDQVFAAAGTPHAIFAVAPQALAAATGAETIAMTA